MPWKYVGAKPVWKGWEIERQQKKLDEFLKEDEDETKNTTTDI